jgi:hypothetical protein
MSTTSMRRSETGDQVQDERARGIVEDLAPLLALPFAGGTWLRGQVLVAGTNRIDHRLGRRPSGWWTTRVQGATVSLYESASDERVLVLEASDPATVDLWVFP